MKTIHMRGGVLLSALLLVLAACSSKKIETKTIQVQSAQEVRYTTSIKAEHYHWRQLSGTKVTLLDADTSTLHFIAPNVTAKTTLLFLLEAQTAFNTQREKIEVVILPKEENNETTEDSNVTIGGSDDNRSDKEPLSIALPKKIEDRLLRESIPYDRITLEVNATSASRLTAINETLEKEHNRTITLRGSKNNGLFYLYNLPLVPGENLIRLQAADGTGKTTEANLTIRADANRSVPIGMRASRYEGVGQLDTVVEVGTDLNASQYLFDLESDGTIETVQSDGNFSLHLTEEGRYRPRVTVRTKEGLLYSSDPYALALDVKADATQKDPKGATPIGVAKAFQTAVLAGDRGEIERLTGNNPNILYLFYGNKHALPLLQKIYASVHEMHEEPWRMDGKTSVVYTFEVNGTTYGGGMELKLISPQLNTGRQWIVDFIY